jgi:hypothetical protein
MDDMGILFYNNYFCSIKKYTLLQTTIFFWFVAFAMMWVVVWNVGVLPAGMLWINIPLSLLETFIGSIICIKLFKDSEAST